MLESENIEKTSINTIITAKLLLNEYGISLKRYADLVEITLNDKSFSKPISQQIRELSKERNETDFDHKKWLDDELSSECTELAAKHAYTCLEIQKQLEPQFYMTDLTSLGLKMSD